MSATIPAATCRCCKRFITYLRVSTDSQGQSGLGLEAQRHAVAQHAADASGVIVAEFLEVESGRKKDRPQLSAALEACRTKHAVLLIAKLDRLARNVAFTANLMEAGVEFIAADMPTVNRLTVHILAAVAEEEARMISARTKVALAAAKARGVTLGRPIGQRPDHIPDATVGSKAAAEKRQRVADEAAFAVLSTIEELRAAGAGSLHAIAAGLSARGIQTPRGGTWTATAVRRVLVRVAEKPAAGQ